MTGPLRLYIAGPFSAPDNRQREANIWRAVQAAKEVMRRGHHAHCPHAATGMIDQAAPGEFPYERWMQLDFSVIRHWATGLVLIGPSPGADREADLARRMGLTVYGSVDEVPDLRGSL